ncbi:MAG: SDR family oxidoreductase [Pirellulales bacterium]|nr:SDR family oxidoreductase [Pirellulales bacterium]
MSKVLVTGGAGFIGSHLATTLAERGDEVHVLDNLSSGKLSNISLACDKIVISQGDLRSLSAVQDAVQDVEVIYHHAALASVPRSVAQPHDTHEHCTTGTLNLLDAARLAGVRRVVFASSSAVYGDQPTAIKRETDPPVPLSPYAAAKIAGEMYCRSFWESYGLETVCLRYFNVFGPRQDPQGEYSAVIPKFVTRMIDGSPPIIFGDGRQSRDFVYIDDVVQGNLAAASAPAEKVSGRCINIACGQKISLLELVDVLNEVLGTDFEPQFEAPRPGDVKESLADIRLARELLNYEPAVSFKEGLCRSVQYYRSLTN